MFLTLGLTTGGDVSPSVILLRRTQLHFTVGIRLSLRHIDCKVGENWLMHIRDMK